MFRNVYTRVTKFPLLPSSEKMRFGKNLSVKNWRKLDALRELPLCRFINSVARTIKTWLGRQRRKR